MTLPDQRGTRAEWLAPAGVLGLAIAMRWLFFTGFFGSDEVTYTEQALATLQGNWPHGKYIGALRYGVNLPVAAFLALLGINMAGAAAWAFLTSVGEVAAVYCAARYLAGARVALLAGLVLAVLPLHVHLAGRLMADSPLALFITLTFLLFKLGQDRNSSAILFTAGLAAGAVYWVKESVVIFLACFALYPLVFRTWNPRWIWMALGAATMFALNCLIFWMLTGDPLHILTVAKSAVDRFVVVVGPATSPFYYPRYLLLDVRHTWLLGPLSLAAAVLVGRSWLKRETIDVGMRYVLFWAVGLLVVFTFTVVAVAPLKLIMKQTNYMTIFFAPLAILAGWLLSRLPRAWLAATLSTVLVGSFVLAALEQQAIKVFTANSKATVAFAQQQRDATVYGTVNALMASIFFDRVLARQAPMTPRIIQPVAALLSSTARVSGESASVAGNRRRIAIIDPQTLGWDDNGIRDERDVPACWRRIGELGPVRTGAGRWISEGLFGAARLLLGAGSGVATVLSGVAVARPASIYEVPIECTPGSP